MMKSLCETFKKISASLPMVLIPVMSIFVVGCGTTGRVVLLPDPDGHVGTVNISNEGGTSTLSQERESLAVNSSTGSPGQSRLLNEDELDAVFGDALAILPSPPVSFSIYFSNSTAEPSAASAGTIANIVAEIKKRDSRDVNLNGHTDTVGTSQGNMKLSLDRAESVRAMLIEQGVDGDHISVTYFGESDLAKPTADNVGEPLNRRVEVVVR
jgi:outer membrane protein OmpA-like peptidoglycan-associated protein